MQTICSTYLRKSLVYIALGSGVFFLPVKSQDIPKKTYKAERTMVMPSIDGILDDETWKNGTWEGDFIQHEPYEGKSPLQKTDFKLRFDDDNIYVAIRAWDTAPDSIVTRLDRRDHVDGDMVAVVFDSYHDLQTGFAFGVNTAGVRMDLIFSNNGQNEDESWDPIWQARVSMQDWGWIAEMKIPLTQLRFKKNSDEVWGFQVGRIIYRHGEMDFWQHIPRNSPGLIHAFGEMDGMQEVMPKKQFDITPYTVASASNYEAEEGNPFLPGKDSNLKAGLDAKVGVTNNLTLDLTLFPDFGQVEADPSEVNLTAYETFFQEKRPFFIEGKNITSFNVGLGDGDVGNDNLFYSRRIGRRPHGEPDLADNEFAEIPSFANIIAAAKLTGKTENGISIGILESVTSEEAVSIDSLGNRRKEQVEPLTNYSLVRLQKDFNKGNTIIGGAVTNTIRNLNGSELDWLHRNATTAGVDYTQYFKDRYYMMSVSLYGSNVQGSAEAISETQQASARYYQRPDADYLDFDPSRTSLSGHGGKFQVGKIGGNWNYLFMNTWKNPGLELNDMGYMREADRILNVLWTGYNFTEPFGIFRSIFLNNDVYTVFDFGGNLNAMGYEANAFCNFTNFWSFGMNGGISGFALSNSALRGGPSMYYPGNARLFMSVETDSRKKFITELDAFINRGFEKSSASNRLSLDIDYRPVNSLNISLSPFFSTYTTVLQYTEQTEFNADYRYIFGSLDQKITGMSVRINYTILPDLTIQYWGQPFLASGKFSEFKMISDPKAENFNDRFIIYDPAQLTYDKVDEYYAVDENLDGTDDYYFGNPDFNFNEWLSNLVVRWEFRPGSTAFLVWSQSRDYSTSYGNFDFKENLNNLYTDKKASNVFLLKLSWRIGIN